MAEKQKITYRKALGTDAVAIFNLLSTYWTPGEQKFDYVKMDDCYGMMWILRVVGLGGSMVAIIDRKIVGAIGVGIDGFQWNPDHKFLFNEWFLVHPKFRRTGIAKRLLEHAKALSAERALPFLFSINSGKDKKLDRYVSMHGFKYTGGMFLYGLDMRGDNNGKERGQ